MGAAVVVSCCFQVWVYKTQSTRLAASGKDLPLRSDSKGAVDREDLAAGVPIQRKRIDDFTAQAGSYKDIDAAIAGLSEPVAADFDIVFQAGTTQDATWDVEFARVLADRRVARLYSLLHELGRPEAQSKVASAFELKLKAHEDALAAGIADWLDGDGKVTSVPVRLNHHAVACVLFLCANYCDSRNVLEMVDQWSGRITRTIAVVGFEPSLAPLEQELKLWGIPQPLFRLNIYLFLAERFGCIDDKAIYRLGDYSLPQLYIVPFCAWDAATNPFDFTHVHRGVPIDQKNVIMRVAMFRSWQHIPEEAQEKLILEMRRKVERCNGDTRLHVPGSK